MRSLKSQFLVIVVSLFLVFLSSQQLAFANEQNDTLKSQVILIAQKLEAAAKTSASPSGSDEHRTQDEKQKLRRLSIYIGFDGTGDRNFVADIEAYKLFAAQNNRNDELELAYFFEGLVEIYNPYSQNNGSDVASALQYMSEYRSNENWLISHSAAIISSVLEGYDRNFSTAISLASESLSLIPDNQSFDAKISKLYINSVDVFLHGTMKNTGLLLVSLERLIESSYEIDYPIQTTELLNNLVYTLRGLADPELTKELVTLLINASKIQQTKTPGLVEMRAAKELIRIGDFKQALELATHGLKITNHEQIRTLLMIAKIQSLAGAGNPQAAKVELENLLVTFEQGTSSNENEIFKAKALIAMASGEAEDTFQMMNQFAELSIQRLLQSNNADTSNLLANLENDKVRQAEREAAREEMYRLEQEALTQRVNATQRGLAIMILLAVAAVLTAAFMTYRSRTSMKLAQSAKAALAAEQAKSQFLAVISHELRTPLNGIIGIADLLSRTAPTDDLRQKISIINNSGQDLLSLVEQILDMSRLDADEMQIFPEMSHVRDVISSVDMLWRPTIENKGVIFTTHVDSSVPQQLKLDAMRLKQCVNNLVSNASKFTSNGRIHVHVTCTPTEGDITATLKVIVADTGMGIRPDVQSNLFRPFVQADSSITRQYGGSGLGLAISRSLAKMMGGDLTVVSREGAGSEFTLTLRVEQIEDSALLDTMGELFLEADDIVAPLAPVTEPPVQDPAEIVPQTTMATACAPDFDALNGVRVLIVEDTASNQDVMKIFLEPEGCEIMCTNNGLEALDAIKDQDFDVILMDIRMPEMDGIEATRLIREVGTRNASVPIIALTADATAETNAQCMAAGANIFLTKPIIATELYDSIRFVRRQAHNRAEVKLAEQSLAKNPIQMQA